MVAPRVVENKNMLGSGPGSSADSASAQTFAESLHELKQQGCLVLVTGQVGDDAKYAGCRRLLGDDLVETRRRLFLTTDTELSNHPGAKATCAHAHPDDSHAIRYVTAARSSATRAPTATLDVERDTVEATLEAVLSKATDAVSRLHERADGFGPSELRVCLDDLDTLIACHDDVTVIEFVQGLRELVLEHRGMCHAHLSRSAPGVPVDALMPYFDAVLEVDSGEDYRQRWHIPESDVSTEWLEL